MSDTEKNRHTEDLDHLIVCPACDLVHKRDHVSEGEAGACNRCGLEFVFPAPKRYDHTIAYATATIPLMIGAVSLPFLSMSRWGMIEIFLVGTGVSLVQARIDGDDYEYVLIT